jgi:hypothetical protein
MVRCDTQQRGRRHQLDVRYIRAYPRAQQEPTSQHAVSVQADWVDVSVRDLESTALANVSLQDSSGLVQTTADYYLCSNWTVDASGGLTFGDLRTDYGSLPKIGSVLFGVVRYL